MKSPSNKKFISYSPSYFDAMTIKYFSPKYAEELTAINNYFSLKSKNYIGSY